MRRFFPLVSALWMTFTADAARVLTTSIQRGESGEHYTEYTYSNHSNFSWNFLSKGTSSNFSNRARSLWPVEKPQTLPGELRIEIREVEAEQFQIQIQLRPYAKADLYSLAEHSLSFRDTPLEQIHEILASFLQSELSRLEQLLTAEQITERAHRLQEWTEELVRYAHSAKGEPMPGRIRMAQFWQKQSQALLPFTWRMDRRALTRWRVFQRIRELERVVAVKSRLFVQEELPEWVRAENLNTRHPCEASLLPYRHGS